MRALVLGAASTVSFSSPTIGETFEQQPQDSCHDGGEMAGGNCSFVPMACSLWFHQVVVEPDGEREAGDDKEEPEVEHGRGGADTQPQVDPYQDKGEDEEGEGNSPRHQLNRLDVWDCGEDGHATANQDAD